MRTKPQMIGSNIRRKPGGFLISKRVKDGLGFGYDAVKKAADDARLRLLNRGGLRAG